MSDITFQDAATQILSQFTDEEKANAISRELVTQLVDAGFILSAPMNGNVELDAAVEKQPEVMYGPDDHTFDIDDRTHEFVQLGRGRLPGQFLPSSVAEDIEADVALGKASRCGSCGAVLPKDESSSSFSNEELVMLEWAVLTAMAQAQNELPGGTGTWMHCSAQLWRQLADRVCVERDNEVLPEPRGDVNYRGFAPNVVHSDEVERLRDTVL